MVITMRRLAIRLQSRVISSDFSCELNHFSLPAVFVVFAFFVRVIEVNNSQVENPVQGFKLKKAKHLFRRLSGYFS